MAQVPPWFNITEDVTVANEVISTAQHDQSQMLSIWITMLVVDVIYSSLAVYIIYKSRKIQRRNFFILISLLILLEAGTAEEVFRMLFMMTKGIAALPVITDSDIECFPPIEKKTPKCL